MVRAGGSGARLQRAAFIVTRPARFSTSVIPFGVDVIESAAAAVVVGVVAAVAAGVAVVVAVAAVVGICVEEVLLVVVVVAPVTGLVVVVVQVVTVVAPADVGARVTCLLFMARCRLLLCNLYVSCS